MSLKSRLKIRSRLIRLLQILVHQRFGLYAAHDLLLDLKYGGRCGGRERPLSGESGGYPVQSTHYVHLARLFSDPALAIQEDDVLVDVGCGKGRVINWWLYSGYRNRMVGIELASEVAAGTRRRLARFRNVEIVTGSAPASIPPAGTLFYLYNPFDQRVMREFADQLRQSVERPERVRVVYFNCRHLDVFSDVSSWTVRPLEIGTPEPAALIGIRRPSLSSASG